MAKEISPLAYAQQKEDEYRRNQLTEANKIMGDLLSRTEMRSERFPVMYDILIKIRGLLWADE